MDISNRTVGSFFQGQIQGQGQGSDTFNYYGSCVMFVTFLTQYYPNIDVINSLDDTLFQKYALNAWKLSAIHLNVGNSLYGFGQDVSQSQQRKTA